MENIKYLFKDTFAVIGKAGQGSADKGSEWIAPLWEDAGAHFSEITDVCRKDEDGGLYWWGAMNDADENNKRWDSTGKYMPGCEADIDATAPDGWTKWIIPAHTYFIVSASPDKYGEIFNKITSDKNIAITGSIHEYYPVPSNPSIMELWFPITEGILHCQSCSMPMTKTEDFGTEADGNPSRGYCCSCYSDGALREGVTIDELTIDIQKLVDIEAAHPDLLSTPLLKRITEWLALDNDDAKAALPPLLSELIDGQDCWYMGTPWEKEVLADAKVCHCIACVAARKCVSDIKLMGVGGI